jgi:uncharacterized protein YbjT (DUF2867 family)
MTTNSQTERGPVLITGGTGKTGRRLAERLRACGTPVRVGSRSSATVFDWEQEATWPGALRGASAAYISYFPDLTVPGASDAIGAFCEVALAGGTRRVVLLSGRGEEEAQVCEEVVARSGADWTVLRCSWFAQNFSEGYLLDSLLDGALALPAGPAAEPFIDVDDIADVAAAVLTSDGHLGEIYEMTGPRLLTFPEAVAEIADAAGRPIAYFPVSAHAFVAEMTAADVPAEVVELLLYLFCTVLDGRNAHLGDGVQRVLGREPRDFRDFAAAVAANGVWDQARAS